MSGANCVLKEIVEYMLLNNQFNDAIFLAERLYNSDKTASSGHTLATCYYRSGCIQQARYLCSQYLDDSSQCALLYGRCCFELRLYQEGLTHMQGLLAYSGLMDYRALEDRFGKDVGVAYCLLGDLNKKLNFFDEAAKMYQLSIQCNPFLWSAYESLCQLGKATLNAEDYFTCTSIPPFLQDNKTTSDKRFTINYQNKLDNHSYTTPELFKTGLSDSSTPAIIKGCVANQRPPLLSFDNSKGFTSDTPQCILDYSSTPQYNTTKPANTQPMTVFAMGTPGNRPLEMDDLITPIQQTVDQPTFTTPLTKLMTPCTSTALHHKDEQCPTEESCVIRNAAPTRSINPRRSARLVGGRGLGNSANSMTIARHRTEVIPSPLTHSRSKARIKIVKSPRLKKRVTFVDKTSSQKPHPNNPQENKDPKTEGDVKMDITSKEVTNEDNEIMKFIGSILNILVSFGSAYKSLSNYQLKGAIRQLTSLPDCYKNSCWVLTQLGQAMMASENFKEASKYYSIVHTIDPHRQEGMDQYSAALWHLQKENELSTLVDDLQSSDKTRPEGLCAISSLMNLYKEHDSAIMYLERAIQQSPRYVYAQTLLGLEYILIKDYDKALSAFQSATSINPRHFNAWYGLGHLFLKQEKWIMAEIYSRRAISINPTSSVVCTQLALILQQQGLLKPALQKVDNAIILNPSNNLPKYHRALILESLEQYHEALKQLESLTSSLPREPLFYKIMSRILLKLGKPHSAVINMSWALDYSHSAHCMVSSGGIAVDRGDLMDSLPGLSDNDFIVHSDDGDFDH